MNITLPVLVASVLIVSQTIHGQALTSVTEIADSAPSAYATIKANRAGISEDKPLEAALLVPSDTARSRRRGARVKNVLVGGAVGILAGAAIGGSAGYWIDTRPNNDGMIPATAILGVYGAIGGLVLGLFTGLVWPVR